MQNRDEQFVQMTDPQKVELAVSIISTLDFAYKQVVINEIAKQQGPGPVQLTINNDDKNVRLGFDRALAYFIIPKDHAVKLAMLLLQHAGAQVQQVGNAPPPSNVIDIKP